MPLQFKPSTLHATAHVFDSPELLENILRYVPECDLRSRVPLVCRAFQDMVRTSLCLRRKLFLAPDWKCTEVHHTEVAEVAEVRALLSYMKKSLKCHITHDKCACKPVCAPSLEIKVPEFIDPQCEPDGVGRLLLS